MFRRVKLFVYIISGIIFLYVGLSFIICGQLVIELPHLYNKINVAKEQVYYGLKDFEILEKSIVSVSDDPGIEIKLKKTIDVKKIDIDIETLSIEKASGQVYYASEGNDFTGTNYIDFSLNAGLNTVELNKRIDKLRLDLTDTKGVVFSSLNITIFLSNNTLLFWIIFIPGLFIYIFYILRIYYHNDDRSLERGNL